MNVTPGYDKAAAYDGSFDRLPAGGYVCRIMKAWVECTPNNSEMLVLALEIAEGDYAGYFRKVYDDKKTSNPNVKWPCMFKQFTLGTDGQTNPFFKGMLKSIEESNMGYAWNWQEATLQNKMIGMIFREEEFLASDGTTKTTVRPAFPRSVQRIRNGVEVPEIKRLNKNMGMNANASSSGFTVVDDDELPWEK